MTAGELQRCIDIIRRWRDMLGVIVVSGTFYFGGTPQELVLSNIRRFAAEVMPVFWRPRLSPLKDLSLLPPTIHWIT